MGGINGAAEGQSSITDTLDYRCFCEASARDDDLFAVFRRQKQCRQVVDTVRAAQGWEHLTKALLLKPGIARLLPRIRENDRVGSPRTSPYPFGRFSPTTMRYVHVAVDIMHRFGSLDGMRIVEIGGGYGGQCRVLSCVANFASYTIFDLNEALQLSQRYLDALGTKNVTLNSAFDVRETDSDLVISNYAVSEVGRAAQDRYIDNVLRRARHGYLILNRISEGFGVDSYTTKQLMERLTIKRPSVKRGALARRDKRKRNDVVYW